MVKIAKSAEIVQIVQIIQIFGIAPNVSSRKSGGLKN